MRCMVVMLVYVILNATYHLLTHLIGLQHAEVINLLVSVGLSTLLLSLMLDISVLSGLVILLASGICQLVMLLLITLFFSVHISELQKMKDWMLQHITIESTSPLMDSVANPHSKFADEN